MADRYLTFSGTAPGRFLTRRLGLPGPVAHGMWSLARCLAEYGARGPLTVEAEFRKPVLLPATVTCATEGTVFALRGGGDGERVHVTGRVLPPAP
jgi:acyl dehydratase